MSSETPAPAPASRRSRLVPDAPEARAGVARVACAGQHLLWSPWAPPVLLDARSLAILDAFDGGPLTDLVDALAEVEQRPAPEVEAELHAVGHQLAWHGLLTTSPPWAHWSPAALNRPVTPCDRESWRLDHATLVDVEVGHRRVTFASADPHLLEALHTQRALAVHPPAADLATAALELVVTPSDRPRGVHQLFGRAGRTYHRSTDLTDVVRSFTAHLGSLAWMVRRPDLVWLDAFALRVPGGAALLPGLARYDWARLGRRLATHGVTPVEAVQVAVDPATGEVVLPPPPAPEVVALGQDWARRAGLDPRAVVPDPVSGDRSGPRANAGTADDEGGRLTVVRVDHVVGTNEHQRYLDAGHRPDHLDPAVGAHRLATLAHHGAMDRYHEPPGADLATTILATVAAVATRPGVVQRLHHEIAPMLASFAPTND